MKILNIVLFSLSFSGFIACSILAGQGIAEGNDFLTLEIIPAIIFAVISFLNLYKLVKVKE